MQRTISAMVGKGSVNHNSRKFKAENVDGSRTHLNIDYCNEPIKKIYHELFDVGFGTFEVSERAAREGRNPQTGETMEIKASKTPKFKAGKAISRTDFTNWR